MKAALSKKGGFPEKKGFLLALVLAATWKSDAAIITAAGVDYASVSNAVASASQGDTVQIPAGSSWWSKTLMISGISLIGSGTNQTIIVDETPTTGNGTPLIQINATSALTRVSAIQIAGGATNLPPFLNSAGEIAVYGTGNLFRIDNCFFYHTTGKPIHTGATVYGLIDHNNFRLVHTTANAIEVNDDTYGDASWSTPYVFGTSNAVYIEDNYMYFETTSVGEIGTFDVANGGRAVIRYNRLVNGALFVHGTDTGQRYRSGRALEAYNNTITFYGGGNFENYTAQFRIQGGSGISFSNFGWGYYNAVAALSYRSRDNDPGFTPWFGATGNNGYDSNSAIVLSGIANATSNALVVGGSTWTPNQWSGYTVFNSNSVNGLFRCGVVDQNTSNTMTFLASRSPGNQITFTNGDPFVVHYVYPQLDQVGRGQGGLLVGAVPAAIWPNQQPEPFYSWSNTVFQAGGGSSNRVGEMASGYANVANGRDFTNTVKAGYVPFTYPHPLIPANNPVAGASFSAGAFRL